MTQAIGVTSSMVVHNKIYCNIFSFKVTYRLWKFICISIDGAGYRFARFYQQI